VYLRPVDGPCRFISVGQSGHGCAKMSHIPAPQRCGGVQL
jgi:hypothetical protein